MTTQGYITNNGEDRGPVCPVEITAADSVDAAPPPSQLITRLYGAAVSYVEVLEDVTLHGEEREQEPQDSSLFCVRQILQI